MIYNTWCPVFPGFYNTDFDSDYEEEREIENINEDRRENGFTDEIEWSDCEFDHKAYFNRVSKDFCSNLEHMLKEKGYVTRLEIEALVSPREYNFTNDSINVVVELNTENILNIQDAIFPNWDKFDKYIKDKYTSCSGFSSFYSNVPKDWTEMTDSFSDFSKSDHYLGSILEFICQIEEITVFEMMQTMSENGDLYIRAENYDDLATKSLNEIRGIEELDDDGELVDFEAKRLENNRNSEGQMGLF
jgi:hypothetical protein